MDALFESIGKLFLVFKDPVNVILFLLAAAEGFFLYKFVQFLQDRYDKDIASRSSLATALTGLTKAIKRDDDD